MVQVAWAATDLEQFRTGDPGLHYSIDQLALGLFESEQAESQAVQRGKPGKKAPGIGSNGRTAIHGRSSRRVLNRQLSIVIF